MADPTSRMLQRERYLILGLLLVLSVLAWALLIWQSSTMSNAQAMGLTGLFVAIVGMRVMISHRGHHSSHDGPALLRRRIELLLQPDDNILQARAVFQISEEEWQRAAFQTSIPFHDF